MASMNFDFSSCGHALCIIDTRASHADLTDEYAAIPGEIKADAAYFGKEVLTQMGVENAVVRVADRGALDCVLRARVETAVLRGMEG